MIATKKRKRRKAQPAQSAVTQRELRFDMPPPVCRLFVECHSLSDQERLARYLRKKGYTVREVTI